MMKRGFTIVELLTVITIIALLFAVAVPSIMGINNKIKRRGLESKISSIEQAAVSYIQQNSNRIKEKYNLTCDGSECSYRFDITVEELVKVGAFESEDNGDIFIENPLTGEALNCKNINIDLDRYHKTAIAKLDMNKENCNSEFLDKMGIVDIFD